MKLRRLRIDKIDPNPDNPRAIDIANTDPDLSALKDSILRFDVLVPILVTARDHRYLLIDGERRFHAAKAARLTHIPAYVLSSEEAKNLTDVDLLYRMFHIHHNRSQWGPIQQCHALESEYRNIVASPDVQKLDSLRAQLKATTEELSARTGVAPSTAYDRIKFLRWPKKLKESLYSTPDDKSYSYIIEVEDKIVIPCIINYQELLQHFSEDKMRLALYAKLAMVSGRNEVRRLAPYLRARYEQKKDRDSVTQTMLAFLETSDMTYEEAEAEFERLVPLDEHVQPPTPRQLCSLLTTVEQKIQVFNVAAIRFATRRAKAKPKEIVAAAESLRSALLTLIEELSEAKQ